MGLTYASRSKVQRVFAADFERSIFSVPLAERRRRLLAIDWVEDASVSRVWPDRLVVRIRERKPVAFVSFRSGPLLIDAAGRAAGAARAGRSSPFPCWSGVREDETEAQRRRARARLAARAGGHWATWRKKSRKWMLADPGEHPHHRAGGPAARWS